MASTSIHIRDMQQAIMSGVVAGQFSENRKEFTFPTVNYTDAKGTNRSWTIMVKLKNTNDHYVVISESMLSQPVKPLENYIAETIVESKCEDGKIREVTPSYTTTGRNLGKANATNCITQALRDAFGLYNKKAKAATIHVDRPLPMLVKKWGDTKSAVLDFSQPIIVQRKLNGVRIVSCVENGEAILYSRTGNKYPVSDKLQSEVDNLLRCATEFMPDLHLDGELYKHGRSLNEIVGQARGKSKTDDDLTYFVYDLFSPTRPLIGAERQSLLAQIFDRCGASLERIKKVENFTVASMEELQELTKKFISENYEGAIARKPNALYEYGINNYHSSNILKFKPLYDSEFKVINYSAGKKGKGKDMLIWQCEVENPKIPEDNIFDVVQKNMSMEDMRHILKQLGKMVVDDTGRRVTLFERDIKGLMLTVEYPSISVKTGKPEQAKALTFRTYEGINDPVANLLK